MLAIFMNTILLHLMIYKFIKITFVDFFGDTSPEPLMTKILDAIWYHWVTMTKVNGHWTWKTNAEVQWISLVKETEKLQSNYHPSVCSNG